MRNSCGAVGLIIDIYNKIIIILYIDNDLLNIYHI